MSLTGRAAPWGFRSRLRGNPPPLIGVALALIVIGLLLGFLAGPYGFIAGIVGLVLLVLYLIGFGRRAASPGP